MNNGTMSGTDGQDRPVLSLPPDATEIDLRPYRRIGCSGAPSVMAAFLAEIANACADHAQVVALPGALEGLAATDQAALPPVLERPEQLSSLLRSTTKSLLVVSLARHEDDLDTLRHLVPETTILRTLCLDASPEADALVVLDSTGGRQMFVRPEFVRRGPLEVDDERHSRVHLDQPPMQGQMGIALLGPVMLTGTDYPLERHPKLTELVVYLALHPEGVSSRNWSTALWPERRVPQQTIANRLSETRRIVGFASDGRPRLRKQGDRYRLVEFNSDWSDFSILSKSASASDWRAALALVRGRPFDDLAEGQWTVFEGFLAEIERTIAQTALALGANALEHGDAELGAWSAQQALKACPFDERLHRLLMRCADASGNRAGVESSLRTLALILEIDGDPLDGVHPKTAKLYGELTASPFSRA